MEEAAVFNNVHSIHEKFQEVFIDGSLDVL